MANGRGPTRRSSPLPARLSVCPSVYSSGSLVVSHLVDCPSLYSRLNAMRHGACNGNKSSSALPTASRFVARASKDFDFWLATRTEAKAPASRQRERKTEKEREQQERKREREQPWHHRLALGHLRDRRIDEPGHLVMLAKKGTTCSPVGTRYSALSSALFWSIWNTEKKVQAIWTFWPKSMEISIAHGGNRGKPRGQVAWGMRQPLNRAFHSSHMVSPSPSLPLSFSWSLLATELPQKRFLILIPKDSPWSIIIIRRASPADLCISRRSRRSSWVHANVNECIWILVRFSTSANTAYKWMRIQVDNRIDEIFFERFNWIG